MNFQDIENQILHKVRTRRRFIIKKPSDSYLEVIDSLEERGLIETYARFNCLICTPSDAIIPSFEVRLAKAKSLPICKEVGYVSNFRKSHKRKVFEVNRTDFKTIGYVYKTTEVKVAKNFLERLIGIKSKKMVCLHLLDSSHKTELVSPETVLAFIISS